MHLQIQTVLNCLVFFFVKLHNNLQQLFYECLTLSTFYPLFFHVKVDQGQTDWHNCKIEQ